MPARTVSLPHTMHAYYTHGTHATLHRETFSRPSSPLPLSEVKIACGGATDGRTDGQVVASLASFTYLDSRKSALIPPQEANITSTIASSTLLPCSILSDTSC